VDRGGGPHSTFCLVTRVPPSIASKRQVMVGRDWNSESWIRIGSFAVDADEVEHLKRT